MPYPSVRPPWTDLKPEKHYVYVHFKVSNGQPFYIGKGQKKRAWDIARRANKHWFNTALKHGVTVRIIRSGMPEVCALTLEKVLINIVGIGNLCNLTAGGQGATGYRPNEDVREKMSKAKKGIPRGPMPEETKDKISAAHRGIRPSDKSREKMRLSHMGQRMGPSNNKFLPTIQIFEHDTLGQFVGTQYDLRNLHGIQPACVRAIITGRQKSAKGWRYVGESK